ncbi:MAG: O-methyltransferase [Candidatus Binatia bacterium]|nr:O-methyltransferase [Candidatus Binatia bacterium]
MHFAAFLQPEIKAYIEQLSTHNDPLLAEMEAVAAQRNFPIIGPVVGRFLYQITLIRKATRIFELGSGYGYSTMWFAKAVHRLGGGEIHHTDGDRRNSEQAQEYFRRAGLLDLVRFHVGDAIEVLHQTPGPFDLLYMDIDKHQYPDAFPAIRDKLAPGGVLIVDNMLWFGRVVDKEDTAASTVGIRRFTQMVWADPEFFTTLVPLRDGFTISVRL